MHLMGNFGGDCSCPIRVDSIYLCLRASLTYTPVFLVDACQRYAEVDRLL